jgi:hypothetical protein
MQRFRKNGSISKSTWAEDMAMVSEGTRMLFRNDFTAAEAIFQRGMKTHEEQAATDEVDLKRAASQSGAVGWDEDDEDSEEEQNVSKAGGCGVAAGTRALAAVEVDPDGMPVHDLRGAFALQWALASFIKVQKNPIYCPICSVAC